MAWPKSSSAWILFTSGDPCNGNYVPVPSPTPTPTPTPVPAPTPIPTPTGIYNWFTLLAAAGVYSWTPFQTSIAPVLINPQILNNLLNSNLNPNLN